MDRPVIEETGPDGRALLKGDQSGLDKIRKPPLPRPNTKWVGGYKVGQGGFGLASAWILVDTNTSKPIDQVVIKDTFEPVWTSTEDKGMYRSIYRQLVKKGLDFGASLGHAPGKAPAKDRFFKEAYMHGVMTTTDPDEEFYTVPLWGYARRKTNMFEYNLWRLYMPLFDCRDLRSLVGVHKTANRRIPEPFLWYTLDCLMKAAILMEKNPRELSNSGNEDVIVVFDMKLENIFLASPDQSKSFPIYPRPYIADLGGACLTAPDDPLNTSNSLPFQYTKQWEAPEMWRPGTPPKGERQSEPILPTEALRGTCTNVWQIGRVLQQLMILEEDPMEIGFDSECTPAQMEAMTYESGKSVPYPDSYYSDDLRGFVRECLQFIPEARPTPQNIVSRIKILGPLYYKGMDIFGSDAWMQTKEGQKAAKPKNTTPLQPSPAGVQQAREYTRAWSKKAKDRFLELAEFPDSDLLIQWALDRNGRLWRYTDPDRDIVDRHGNPIDDLEYRYCVNCAKNVDADLHFCPKPVPGFGGGPPRPKFAGGF
ncbi:hypothetical protein D6D18_02236 [Aureobasidium pullulans]|uniref:Protein kinase domain-containing protein n=1 Tax=Aureobasidium pullulans TaxID=5580 RepID=A0A4S8YR53_AURPU|nr:hypothetical protein D6D20_08768 [Aureobasidium pullulans]THX07643.1 hypothetical protein D6D18_02236 [Aureobasidium pullulans]THZ95954.1 hypothetical protein D6C82_07362 [Aureobasidium pullulans]